MTKKEAAIVTAYTGIVIGEFSEAHKYMQEKLGRPIFTHELAEKKVVDLIKTLALEDFVNIEITD